MDKTLFSIHFEVKKSAVVALVCMGIGYAIGCIKTSRKKSNTKSDTKSDENKEEEDG